MLTRSLKRRLLQNDPTLFNDSQQIEKPKKSKISRKITKPQTQVPVITEEEIETETQQQQLPVIEEIHEEPETELPLFHTTPPGDNDQNVTIDNDEKNQEIHEKLDELWHDPAKIGSFRGPNALYEQAKKDGLKVTHKNCRDFLLGKPYYSEYRSLRKNFPRNVIRNKYIHTYIVNRLM